MKRALDAAHSDPEEESLARLGYHVDSAGKFLPAWAAPTLGAGLDDDNPIVENPLPNVDPQLQASAGNPQQGYEPLFFPEDNGNDNNDSGDHPHGAAVSGIQPDSGFYKQRCPEESPLHHVEQFLVEPLAAAGSLNVPEPQHRLQLNHHATTPTANLHPSTRAKKPRKPKDKPNQTGRHSAAEISAIEDFKSQFCQANDMSSEDFGRMVQHRETDRADFPCPESIMTRSKFWELLYALMPRRRRKDVHRYMRSHYVATSQKPRQWTREQDDELAVLHAKYGSDFAKIARILGRSRDDVNTRFRKHVQHRDTQNHGSWTDAECVRLENAVRQWRTAQAPEDENAAGCPVPEDIYQIDPYNILWSQVSELMGHTRTKEQCAAKWRAMQKKRREEGHNTGPK
ncbi:conserved hypothetical protein [Histoplasma capsulatum G186AR]|uniref:Uncharacterized protein n=1 Tax=Ajellomyces capsulatus (strain G186AR / H82 / ATCC MYA-2454 / RMSCC 2432) TaxID=447093 RepID=C0NGU2_AJECG|nr:uncharacterized protein HCBG_02564 [Histoplasma capsulatum G186AR]EEH09027.1 conserved hypothetical protein [Histoplasma capsulatum G186AR]